MHCSTEGGVRVSPESNDVDPLGFTLTEFKDEEARRSEARRSLLFDTEDFL